MKECFIGGTIVHNLTSRDKFSAIQEIIHKAPVFSGAKDTQKIKNAVLDREQIHSTGLGRGVAIAHGETEEVDNLIITLGISPGGIDFDACDNMTVSELLARLDVKTPDIVTVWINGKIVKRSGFESTHLKEGDRMDFRYFVVGG